MKEQQIQTKIIKFLESKDFLVVKTMVVSKAGVPDLLCCSPNGRFWAIEVKTPQGKASKLQEWWIRKFLANKAIAFFAYGYEDFLVKFQNGTIIESNCDIPSAN